MLLRIHQKLGTAGFIISIVALVAALGGGAYAASEAGLNKKQKKQVNQIAKSYQGKGLQGDTGAQGAKGENGAQGSEGKPGNEGKAGKEGKEGSPWTAGGTLPPGETETGAWSISVPSTSATSLFPVSISFPIPLSGTANAVYLTAEETANEAETGGCIWEQDNSAAAPEAPGGTLCVFEELAEKINAPGFLFFASPGDPLSGTAGPAGIYAWFSVEGEENPATLNASGVWAVTAGPSGP